MVGVNWLRELERQRREGRVDARMNKTFISAEQLERDSWDFAIRLHEDGHRFDWVVGVARGGAQISIYMQEALCLLRATDIHYAAIQAWSYTAIGEAEDDVQIRNLRDLSQLIAPGQSILVIDDVFDRGNTLKAIGDQLSAAVSQKEAKVLLGALYWKPENNQTGIAPDFHFRTYAAADWLVFPHELCGLNRDELAGKGFPVERLS